MYKPDLLEKIERMTAIGIDLSVEKDHDRLLETILRGAKEIAGADAGTLYLLKEDNCLHFTIVMADSLDVTMGGTSGNPVTLEGTGLFARTLQHETGHLDGFLYVDKLIGRHSRAAKKTAKKNGWGVPGLSWLPGEVPDPFGH